MLMVKLRVLKVNPYQNNFYPERNSPHPVFAVKILVAPCEMCRGIISYQNKQILYDIPQKDLANISYSRFQDGSIVIDLFGSYFMHIQDLKNHPTQRQRPD